MHRKKVDVARDRTAAVTSQLSTICQYCACFFHPKRQTGYGKASTKCGYPRSSITRRSQEDKVPYQAWADAGYVTVTPGVTTDFFILERDILALHKKWNFIDLGLEESCIPDMYQRLEKSGIKITSVEQGYRLSPAIRRVEKLISEHKFAAFGNPIFNWAARNCQFEHRPEKKGERRTREGKVTRAHRPSRCGDHCHENSDGPG